MKSHQQMRLTSAGHTASATRAMSYFSGVSRFNDRTGGIAFYKLIEAIEEQFDARKEELISILKELITSVFCKEDFMISLTAEPEVLDKVKERIAGLQAKLFDRKESAGSRFVQEEKKNEGFETSGQVQYVAMAGNFCKDGYTYTGALRILKTIMAYEYLWSNIRVQGGAYGCMSGYGRTGDTYFVSYRDPNLGRTVGVYEGIADYLKNFSVSDRDMCKYIIGTMSEVDTPMNPQAKGARSLMAYLCHITQNDLQRERNEILSATPGNIRALAPLIESVVQQRNLCVIGSAAKIESEKSLFYEIKPLIGQGENE